MANVKCASSSFQSGCLVLFALPFAAVGVGMGAWLASTIFAYLSARSWVEAPAQIVRTELKDTGEESTSYEVTAEYVYKYDGEKYTGHRVVLSGADNIGSFHQDVHRQLSEYQETGKPFRCYVNPARPAEAVLYRDFRWELAGFQMIFVVVFGGLGFGLIIGSLIAYRKGRVNSALAAANPEAPWMWKADWAAGRIVSSSLDRVTMLVVLAFAVFWNVISAPLWFQLPGEIIDKGNRWALLGLLFPAVGLFLVGWAIVLVIRWRKFGESVFQMVSVPGVIGGQLAGVIRTPVKVRPEDGFHFTLACIRKIMTGSGDDSSTSEEAVWEDARVVAHGLLDDLAEGSAIPVVFPIPYDCRPTDESAPRDQTVWRLKVTATVPGVAYAATFEVPVFKTPDRSISLGNKRRTGAGPP